MRLSSVIFYQGVKLWDGNMYGTVKEGVNGRIDGVSIDLTDHIITLSKTGESMEIVVGTANMRNGTIVKHGAVVEDPTVGHSPAHEEITEHPLEIHPEPEEIQGFSAQEESLKKEATFSPGKYTEKKKPMPPSKKKAEKIE